MARGVYVVHGDAQTISTAITILEVTAPSTAALVVLRAWVACNTTTAGAARIRLLRKTGTCTSAASAPSAVPLDGSAASGATIKWVASSEGTDGNVLIEDVMRLDGGGWVYLPVPEERPVVPPSGIIALKFAAAPASGAYTFGLVYQELS